jgi:hypothetical protein
MPSSATSGPSTTTCDARGIDRCEAALEDGGAEAGDERARRRVGVVGAGAGRQRHARRPGGDEHLGARELGHRARHRDAGDAAQGPGEAALRRGLVLEVELVERQLARVAQHRAGVERGERRAQRGGEDVEQARSLRTDARRRAGGP